MAGPPGFPPIWVLLPAKRRRGGFPKGILLAMWLVTAVVLLVVAVFVLVIGKDSSPRAPIAASSVLPEVSGPATRQPSSTPSASTPYGVMPGWVPHNSSPPHCVGLAAGHGLATMTTDQLAQVLKTASALKCWVTWDLPWRELQPHGARQGINWDALGNLPDAVQRVEQTQSADQQPIRLLGVLGYAPTWANLGADGCDQDRDCGPDAAHVHDYGVIARQVAAYLRGILGANCFELMGWYRPNSRNYFWPDPSPRLYAQMMKDASPALKRMGIPFIMGGLATDSTHERIIPADMFLQSVYTNAGGRYWDAVGVNLGGWQTLQAVHKVMKDRIDITELDTSPGTGAQYTAALYSWPLPMHWLGFVLLKVSSDAIDAGLVQQIQSVQTAGGSSP